MIGDFEPEDAWHPDDPVDVLARNLARRLEHIAHQLAARGGRADRRTIDRARDLAGDLQHFRNRIAEL